ncbi:hypothetical protein FQA39_LY16610 [Lamprigera yunnana]|nr:hypothetical protein FQA39_LY16610 [Lamprigera yunnana]
MYSTPNANFLKKPKATTGYLARPRLGAYKSLYPSKTVRPITACGFEKRKKSRKLNESKMEFRKRPDYADTAYREAVSRLKVLLADSYTPIKRPIRELDSAGEETDNQSLISAASRNSRPSHLHYKYTPSIPKRYPYYPPRTFISTPQADQDKQILSDRTHSHPELVCFIEKQEDYIEQLEKESKFCRDELAGLLRRVKDVISENDDLHDKQKSTLIKSVFHRLETETESETESDAKKTTRCNLFKSPKRTRRQVVLEGPTIVFESRISELEAQLTQTKIDLRKALDENDSFKRKLADGSLSDGICVDTHRKQIEALQRDKNVLQDTVSKLQNALSQFKDKESISTDQVKRSLDAVEQAQYEKNSAELEIRRLKDELERQHGKLRDAISEQSRRISDERSAMERRYAQQIDQLTTDLGVQWETTSKVQLELEKQRRDNSDLRRELAQKQAYIDELKKEMNSKIATMQSDIGLSGAEKSALEQQVATQQLTSERNERQSRQEVARLQAELQSLRQRLDRSDADLIHSRRENIRFSEQIASLEKEIKLNEVMSEERGKRAPSADIVALPSPAAKEDRGDNDLSTMVRGLESKHAATVAELEGMIHSQNQLMDKLTGECQTLTIKLEDANIRHKEEIRELQANLDYLSSRVNHTQSNNKLPSQYEDEKYNIPSTEGPTQHQPITSNQTGYNRTSPTAKNLSRTNSNVSIKQPIPARKPSISQNQPYTVQEQPQPPDVDQYATDPCQQYPTYTEDPNQYSADPNQQYDPNYAYDANDPRYMEQAQYDQAYDPNLPYEGDPNQMYTEDPNQTYSTDPNIYSADPNQESNQEELAEQKPQEKSLDNDAKNAVSTN